MAQANPNLNTRILRPYTDAGNIHREEEIARTAWLQDAWQMKAALVAPGGIYEGQLLYIETMGIHGHWMRER